MPAPSVQDLFQSFYRIAGPNTQITGVDLQNLVKTLFNVQYNVSTTSSNGITAAQAVLLTGGIASVTSGTASGSVMLPPAQAGQSLTVVNISTNYITVYGYLGNTANPSTNDQIAPHNTATPAATATGAQQASASMAIYAAYTTGIWKQMLTA